MVYDVVLNLIFAAGLGNGVTSNKRVSASRQNVYRIVFLCPETNTGPVYIGEGIYSEPPPSFTPPALLSNTNYAAKILPGGNAIFEVPSHLAALGHKYDLSQFYSLGNVNDELVVRAARISDF